MTGLTDNRPAILVAGIGNIFLGDDGFGSEVLRRLPRNLAPHRRSARARATDYGIGGMHLAYDLLDEWDALVLVDALPVQGHPGRLHVFEADTEGHTGAAGLDAHAMDPTAVFAGLTALGGVAPHTVVVGCEVASVDEAIGLSAPVAAAVPDAVRAVREVVSRLLDRTALPGTG